MRLVSLGIFWFLLALSVESSIVPIADIIFEHRVYLGSAGAFMALSVGAQVAVERLAPARMRYVALAVVGLVAVGVLCSLTVRRNAVWSSEKSLWADVVMKSPKKARGYNNLGIVYLREGRLDDARALFDRAVSLDPAYAEAYSNRGGVYERMNRLDDAIGDYSRSVELNPFDADYYYNRGYVKSRKKEYEAALLDYSKAAELNPKHDKAYVQRGITLYLLTRDAGRALPDLQRACELGNPVGCQIVRGGLSMEGE